MSGGIHASPRALTDLKNAIERFVVQLRGLADESVDIAGGIERHVESLEAKARDGVADARRALAEAGEEDKTDAVSDLEDARERLRTVRRTLNTVGRAFSKLRRAAENAREAAVHGGAVAPAHLQRKLSELADYSAVDLGGHPAGPSAFAPGPLASAATTCVASPADFDRAPNIEELQKAVLPTGWKWVRLEEIDTTLIEGETLPIGDETRQELIRRFNLLRRDVLPLLDRNRSAAADRLRQADNRDGIYDASGRLGAFETFFSLNSPIHLQRAAGADRYTIDDGRSRIDTAHVLGFPAVPARTIDLSQEE